MSGKTGLLLVLIIASAALVYGVTARLSDQTIDIIVGLACGLAATVPVSIGLLIALTRRRPQRDEDEVPARGFPQPSTSFHPYAPRQPYPPVIVITPQQGQIPNPYGGLLPPGSISSGYSMNEPPMGRDFRIIGEDEDTFDA